MAKIKNSEVLTLFESINMLEMYSGDLPVKIFYANSKNRNKLKGAYEEVNDTRFKLLEKYGIKDDSSQIGFKLEEDGRTFLFKDKDSKTKFSKELEPIMDMEIDISLHKIKIDDFNGMEFNRQKFPLIDFYIDWLVD